MDSESNCFLITSVLCDIWKVRRAQRDIPAAVSNFAREIVPGAGESFTKPVKRIISNDYESLIASNVRPLESGSDLIIPGSCWLKNHQLTNTNDIANWRFESQQYITQCLVTMDTKQKFEIK